MKLRAQAFDASTGTLVCERDRSAFGSSFLGVALVGGGLIPVFDVLDETAFWKHAAWRLGYVVAGCFVQPAAETTTSVNAVSDGVEIADVTFPKAIWWFGGTYRVAGRFLVTQGAWFFLSGSHQDEKSHLQLAIWRSKGFHWSTGTSKHL
jgi:hypothetical protein